MNRMVIERDGYMELSRIYQHSRPSRCQRILYRRPSYTKWLMKGQKICGNFEALRNTDRFLHNRSSECIKKHQCTAVYSCVYQCLNAAATVALYIDDTKSISKHRPTRKLQTDRNAKIILRF